MTDIQSQIVTHAQKVHQRLWIRGTHVGTQTRLSNTVCRAWQEAVTVQYKRRLIAECPLGGVDAKQKIDLVDIESRIAYELKASPNNTHMELYRDIFKVLVFNHRNPDNPLHKYLKDISIKLHMRIVWLSKKLI
jgi:hypothetical protein